MTTFSDVLQQLEALSARTITLDDLPIGDLRKKLFDSGEPLDLSSSLDQTVGWAQLAPLSIRRVSALPADPRDNEIISYVADATNGVEWLLRYTSSEPTYKWRYIGGPPLFNEVATAESTASAAYVALATAGPSIALPLAGDYMVEIGAGIDCSAGAGAAALMSYDIGGTAAVDTDVVRGGDLARKSVTRPRRKTLAAVTLTAKYRATAGTADFIDRFIRATPIRIG